MKIIINCEVEELQCDYDYNSVSGQYECDAYIRGIEAIRLKNVIIKDDDEKIFFTSNNTNAFKNEYLPDFMDYTEPTFCRIYEHHDVEFNFETDNFNPKLLRFTHFESRTPKGNRKAFFVTYNGKFDFNPHVKDGLLKYKLFAKERGEWRCILDFSH